MASTAGGNWRAKLLAIALVILVFGAFGSAQAQAGETFQSTDAPKSITDNGSVDSTLTINDERQITEARVVDVRITHSFAADLDISLIGPDATSVELSTDNCPSARNSSTAFSFWDGAATSVTTAPCPTSGAVRPEAPLSALNGKNAQGTWKLRVADDTAGDTGSLLSWGVELSFAADPDGNSDGDGVPDATDNCPGVTNPAQADGDGDGLGDACDTTFDDSDGDTIGDGHDNCPSVGNPGQQNADGDSQGDACDSDDDGDTVDDGVDNCPLVANVGQGDTDGDTQGDACDGDDDGDTVQDGSDNCPLAANPGQANADGDAQGDACDSDRDGDGAANGSDNCPDNSNAGQADTDGDGQGDPCDSTPGGVGAVGSTNPGSTTQTGGTNDTLAPSVSVSVSKQKLGKALSKGLVVSLTGSEGGTASGKLLLAKGAAKKLKLAAVAVTVGSGKASLAGAGKGKVVLRFSNKAKKRLKRANKVSLSIQLVLVDAAGNRSKTVTKKITLKR